MTLLAAGQVFDQFVLESRLAMGGMAELWVAKKVEGDERRFALKFPKDHLLSNQALRSMFLDECRIAKSLRHPNIVKVIGGFEHEGCFFQAMELVLGHDLKKVLVALAKKDDRFASAMAVRIARDIARGLSYAHQKRTDDGTWLALVHRDVSPQNIMILTTGEVKVVDFGVAKAAARLTKTKTGVVKGKIPYMAPEQALAKEVSASTDIFALGVILWELLAMRRLFAARSEMELFRLVSEALVPPIDQHAVGLPESVREIVMQMLARRPSDRPGSMREVEERLSRILFVDYPNQDVSASALADWLAPRLAPRPKTKVMPAAVSAPEPPLAVEEPSTGRRRVEEVVAPWLAGRDIPEDGPTVRASPDTTLRLEEPLEGTDPDEGSPEK